MRLSSRPVLSRASSSSQSEPQITLMTFQPAPWNAASSSWMILPLPRTGPSSRCRLQLTTQIRLSRFSRDASVSEPSVSGSSRFAVADERPHLRLLAVDEAARLQVAVEPRLVNRQQRPQPHRDGRELPEIRHQIRMRIRGQPAAFGQFLAEILQVLLVQPPFQERPRINARRGVPLEVNHVADEIVRPPAEEMVEPHLVQRRRRGVGRDVPAQAAVLAVGVDHHRHRVPADVALDPPLHLPIPRERRLLIGGDGVDVRRADHPRHIHAARAQPFGQAVQEARGLLRPLVLQRELQHGLQRLQPLFLLGLLRLRQHVQLGR